MIRSICLALLLSLPGLASAQTETIARLRAALQRAPDPAGRLAKRLELLEQHESLFKDSLMPLAAQTLLDARRNGTKEAIGLATLGLIHAYLRVDSVSAADSLVARSLPEFRVSGSAPGSDIYPRLRLERATIRASAADYSGAVAELLAVLQLAEKAQQHALVCRALNELGVISYNRNELPQALDFYRKALSYGDRNPRAGQTAAYAYINIAMVHGWREEYDSALHYIGLAKPLCERLDNLYYLANAYAVEANVHKWSGNIRRAESSMLRMVELRERTEGSITFSNEQLSLANFYVYAGETAKAIALYQDGLNYMYRRHAAGAPVNYELVLRYYEGLAKCFKTSGLRNEYEAALERIVALKDTLSEQSSSKAIAEMQTRYEVQKKETTIIAQKLDITRKNVLIYGSLLLTAILAFFAWLIFRNYRRRSLLRLESERSRAIRAVREAEEAERRRIAADLHDSLGSYAASIKSNADEMMRDRSLDSPVINLLQTNAQQMVSLLADTIWAMRKEHLRLSDISDRVKIVLQRLRQNYPAVQLRVTEALESDPELPPVQAYHLFMIIQEAVNNALRHSGADEIGVSFRGGAPWQVHIRDNGTGLQFPGASDGGNGLSTMRERAASMGCTISWEEGAPRGTVVVLQPTSN